MLDDLGLLEGIGREADNITKIIWRCLRNYRDKALISYCDTATYSHAFKVTEYPWNNPPVNTRSSCPYANQPEAGAVRRRQGVRPWHLARRPQQVRQRDP